MRTPKHYNITAWLCLLRFGATVADVAAAYGVSTPTVYNKTKAARAIQAPLTTQEVLALAQVIENAPNELHRVLLDPRNLLDNQCAAPAIDHLINYSRQDTCVHA